MQEKTMFGNGLVTLTLLSVEDYYNLEKPIVSSVHCFPVRGNDVLFTVNPRGIDIIGGHVEKNENIYGTLLREAKEEASIVPVDIELIGVVEVDNSENPEALNLGYALKSYQVFFGIKDFYELPFMATHECTSRIFIDRNDIQFKHHNWLKIQQKLLDKVKSY
jgi:8-oxo-dGTP pyrophosphatase MutT (NUDIX family)